MAPFYLKIGLDIGQVLGKYIIFNEIFLNLPYRLSKSTHACQFTWLKVLIGLKRALHETNGLDIGRKFTSSLV